MRIKWICIGLVAVLSLAVGAGAEENGEADTDSAMMEEMRDLYGDEAFVTIATGSRKPIYKAPSVATVITADEMEAMGARNLDEVLRTVAGLHVAPSTQGRVDSIYSIRGIHTKYNPHVLVLINSVPFPFFTGGRPFHFRLPLSGIERVEVIRGPGSAVYGADAFAGVVNIITKASDDMRGTEIGGRIGSFDTHDLWFQHGRSWGNWDVAFSLEWQKADGDKGRRIDSDLQSNLDQIFGTNASHAPEGLDTRYNVLNTHLAIGRDEWLLRHWYWGQDDAGLGAGTSLALDPNGGEDLDQNLIDLTYRKAGVLPNLDFVANLNYLHFRSDSRYNLLPPGNTVPIDDDGNLDFGPEPARVVSFSEGILGRPEAIQQNTGLDLIALYAGESHRLRFASGIKHFKMRVKHELKNFGPGVIDGLQENTFEGNLKDVAGTPDVFMPDKSRTAWYLSVQDEWQFNRDWELTAGVRYDEYSDFGGTINPRLALVWAPRHNLINKVLYGRAFRAPSFLEKYLTNNPVAIGNPDLSPETIDTFEVVFDYRPFFDVQTVLNLFAYKAKDLIEFVPDPAGTNNTAQNARDQDGYGFELEVGWKVSETLRLRGHYAWQHSEDADTGHRIADAPGQKIYASADWEFLRDWTLFPQITWVGHRKRAEGDSRPPVGDYTLVDLTLHRARIFGNLDLALAVRNVFDKDAREPSTSVIPADYPMEGRNFWGEIQYRF